MRRTASVFTLIVALVGIWCIASAAQADDCYYDPVDGKLVCSPGGTIPGGPGHPPGDRPPIRYVYTSTDPVVGDCHYWSRIPGGIDAWDPANDPTVIRVVNTTPVCPVSTDPPEAIAWQIFRSFPLALPSPSFEPPDSGITGLPTFLATPDAADITHTEVLPDGRTMDVRATVAALVVNWGDGVAASFDPSEALAYPTGHVTHTYTTKTCDATYRQEHPSGGNCHATLEAYPVTATFTWAGRYRIGGGWIDLGTLNRSTTVAYDVDEVQGVLQP